MDEEIIVNTHVKEVFVSVDNDLEIRNESANFSV